MDPNSAGDALTASAINIRPKNIYGLRTDVIGNIHFNLNQEVIYPVEGVLAFHDYVSNKQRFLRLPEDTHPEYIAMSVQRKLLAVIETCPKIGTSISIYDLATLKKRRSLPFPNATASASFMSFTADAKTIVILTKPPDEALYMLLLDKTGTVIESHPTMSMARGSVECFACNPQDHCSVAVGGDCVLLLMAKSEKGMSISNNIKADFHTTSMAFIANDLLMIGTSQNELIMLENGDVKLRQKAHDAELIDILWDQDALNKELEHKIPTELKLSDQRVVCMTAFQRGFAFAIFNMVFVFERISKFKLERKTILTIPFGFAPELSYQITNIAICARQETIIVTTKHAQIYVGVLIVPETLKAKQLQFQPLGAWIHLSEITSMSVCSWKPIIMTASRDQTVRIWNYETDKVELVRKFQVDVNIVELNSTGLMAAIGFSDQLRITQIFMDELNIVKTYNFPRCKDVKYSNYGHFMAAAYDNIISITSVYNLDIVRQLKGHNGTVLSIAWSATDKYLISGGAEGAIYQWDVETGARVQEIVQKGTEYRSVCCTFNEPLSIYAATNFGVLREFNNSEVVREIVVPSKVRTPLTDMCLSRSDLIMFVGNEDGDLFNIQLPFMDAGGASCTLFRFFTTQINKLFFSYDGTLLLAISKNGTLAIWAMDNIEGKVAPMDADLMRSQEVLIPRSILFEKNEQIANLEIRLRQQAEEFQYQLSQNEIFDGEQLAEVHRSYCQALEELKNKNNEIEQKHTEEMNQITYQINDIRDEHKKHLDNLANQYSERMLVEYQKFSNLRESMLTLRESYENKLKSSAGILQDTVEGLETDYKRQLDERKELIRELMKEMQDKKVEFFKYCREVEEENDRNMVDMQLQYENKLNNEQNATQLWRGKSGILDKRYQTLSKDIEKLLEEVDTLKEEHTKSQKNIGHLTRSIDDLMKDISDRDYAINTKEKRIQELLHKNQELDKYKQVLSHKIAELKAQIEPREFQINDKRKHILEMENELEGLNQNNIQLELQLKELKDKYLSNVAEMKVERHRSRAARECVTSICSEIYHVAAFVDSPKQLQVKVKELFQRHASDDELKRHISLDAEVRDEFQRQRGQIERVLKIQRNRRTQDEAKKYQKLFKENVVLVDEVDRLREENAHLRHRVKKDLAKQKLTRKS
ncbi:cilia- and flagella-associated protein 57 [Anastrepha ludens]|uniref:cilia- and flagella-associated protein 57 n=1 Tax=Anastrepha ludens TaxID=28586 RepID=UPI0023AEF7E6|nr:cilia- and flagella-associated protein 57 [Anastrepha ludens]